MAHNPDAFIREVDEELRHDRLSRLWRRYGLLVIAGAVAIVAATAGVVIWDYVSENRRQADALAFEQAIEQAGGVPTAAADALVRLGDDARTGYAVVARFTAAQIFAADGNEAAALDLLDRVSNDAETPEPYGDLATILAIAARADDASPDATITALRPFTATSPWRHTARELTAAALLQAGDREQAITTLRDILQDEATPTSTRVRVRELLAALGVDEASAG
ncbi:MAG: tetratricopeptide repeat protein [Pseudomonadota bacterium]